MKWTWLFLFLLSAPLWSKPLILVSYYDAFGKASFNNSEKVAKGLAERLNEGQKVKVQLCPLNTVFDKSYAQLEDCLKALGEEPLMVIGLGESNCNVKIETIGRNRDKTIGPDNEGNERKGEILPQGPKFLAMRYPLPQMFCSLAPHERKDLQLSNDAGSFVCNNTAYQLINYHPHLNFGFIHIPSSSCKNLEEKTETAINVLGKMIIKGSAFLQTSFRSPLMTPHPSNEVRLPITKSELTPLRKRYEKDPCMQEFFKKYRAVDESNHWLF